LGEDFEVVCGKVFNFGAFECYVVDVCEEFVYEYVLLVIKVNVFYGGGYLFFIVLGWLLIVKFVVEKVCEVGCDTIAYGCMGKGND